VILREGVKPGQKPISTIEDIIRNNFIASCTVMYRHGLIETFPDWWFSILNADWTLHIFHAQHGDIGYIPEILSAYRFNPEGIWRRLRFEDRLKVRIRSYTAINKYLKYQYDSLIQPTLSDHWRRLRNVYIEKGFQAGREDANIQNVSKIFENWPQDPPFPPKWKAEVLSEIYNRLLFYHHQNHHPSMTRYCCIQLVLFRPSRFRNKGILKVCFNAFLGSYFMSFRSK
jgi:hypothetical protein